MVIKVPLPVELIEGSTARKIIDTALLMVQKRGFSGFSFRDIATEIGIKTASIHYHFPTKPDLAQAILQEVQSGFKRELERIDSEVSNPREKLKCFFGIFDETFGDGDRLCPFCMVACAQDGVPAFVKTEVQAFWSTGERWAAAQIAAGQQSGLFNKSISADTSGRVLVAMLEGAMVTARAFDERQRLEITANWFLSSIRAA